ncbi:MAG: hypothetical protein RRA15_13350 [bacterium]|nr:hypothetical protein [bacterium]MDT8367446.1 hypothetical protein [bacterium]
MMIFLDEADRIKYLNILHTTIERFNWRGQTVGSGPSPSHRASGAIAQGRGSF